ncbi:hypothetical protein CDAR_220451 [Caerostris darwini]|uniref:Uncharacterized protein n=1 Tax=Caerostris darwini TaxID=1538125 RepID=A0AAV4UFS5_9ARAC|nr:hypothetical protein CDAR_220451 [Caerostris darwini]
MRSAPNASDSRGHNEECPMLSLGETPGNGGIKEIIDYQSISLYQQTQTAGPSPSALTRGDNSPRNEYPPMTIKTHAVSLQSPPHAQ